MSEVFNNDKIKERLLLLGWKIHQPAAMPEIKEGQYHIGVDTYIKDRKQTGTATVCVMRVVDKEPTIEYITQYRKEGFDLQKRLMAEVELLATYYNAQIWDEVAKQWTPKTPKPE